MTIVEALLWLALNVYHEARSDSLQGQVAVVYVVLNRSQAKQKTVREIITAPYQFSWVQQKRYYLPHNPKAFLYSMQSVLHALTTKDFTNGATHYHLQTIRPYWSRKLHYQNQYGSHLFYKE